MNTRRGGQLPTLTARSLILADARRLSGDDRLIWALVASVAVIAVGGLVFGFGRAADGSIANSTLAAGFAIAALLLQILALMVGSDGIAGEIARGTLDATLSVVPRRSLLLTGRACATALVLAVADLLAAIAAGVPPLILTVASGRGVSGAFIMAWGAGTVGLVISTVAVGLVSLSVGVVSRQRSMAILAVLGLLYLAPLLVALLPTGAIRTALDTILPSSALARISSLGARPFDASMAVALVDLAVIVLIALAAARVRFDASSRQGGSRPRRSHHRPRAAQPVTMEPTLWSFRAQVSSELVKATSQPALRVLIPTAVVVALGFAAARSATDSLAGVGGTIKEGLLIEFPYAITGGVGAVAFLTSVIAIAIVTSEHETGTAAITFTAAPCRTPVNSAKVLVATLTGTLLGLVTLLPAYTIAAITYTLRGYELSPDVFAAGMQSTTRAALFLLLICLLSTGLAGLTRRTVSTALLTAVGLVLGPAAFNTVLGAGRSTNNALLITIGNLGRFLPWEGSNYYSPGGFTQAPFVTDVQGALQVSQTVGITVTAAWAAVALITWILSDLRRPIESA